MAMFKATADIKTSDQLHLPVPEAKFETVVVKPSEIQQDMVQALSERAAKVHSGCVDPAVDNMLKITSDGRKIGLDQRLMNDALPDDPNSKLNACVRNVLKIWAEGKEQKLTQLIFCDMSTPKGAGSFNVYDDIRAKLLSASVPEQEIAFIHNADTEEKKSTLFSKVRSGDVRILLGSTAKMGAGTNVQTRLVAVHHLDVGWRPSDMTQRNGRIQKLKPIIRSTAAYAPPETLDGQPPVYPYTPIKSNFEDAGTVQEMMMYTELQSAVQAMIQRLEYSFTFNPSLLTIPKRKQQVTEILEEAEKYIWRIKEEMRCA